MKKGLFLRIFNSEKNLIATGPNANLLHLYLISLATGALTKVESEASEKYPQQVTFLPDGQFALVINKTGKSITTFLVDENTGTLKVIRDVSTGSDPQHMIILKVSN